MNHPQKKLTLWMLASGLMLTVAISPALAKAQASSTNSTDTSSDTTTKKSKKKAKKEKAAAEEKAAAADKSAASDTMAATTKKSKKSKKTAAADASASKTAAAYTVLSATSGGEALKLASNNWVDVVIVDYCMPEMNRQEVAIEMRRLKPQAKIIMLSGAVDVPEEVLTRVDAFVAKDRLASQLLSAIEQLTVPWDTGPLRPLGSDM